MRSLPQRRTIETSTLVRTHDGIQEKRRDNIKIRKSTWPACAAGVTDDRSITLATTAGGSGELGQCLGNITGKVKKD